MLPKEVKYEESEREVQGQTTIAQISDLHFSAQTSPNDPQWRALSLDLQHYEPKIDLLVATGDLIDAGVAGLWQKDEALIAFKNVYAYLHQLCEKLGIDPEERLVVVPGNHDYRLKGLLWKRVQSEAFLQVFKDRFRPVFLRSLGVCALVLDSNAVERGVNLATGMVESNDLIDFMDLVEKLRDDKTEGWNACTRIALLHHHPMPIAATEGRGFIEHPGFLLLKNAAQFMTTMVSSKIDLILHGHQHYPAFSKASFPTQSGDEHLITIIGAGTVGKEVDNYSRSYNLVTITPNREIHLERRVLPAHKYESAFKVPIRTFADARRLAFEGLAKKAGAELRVKKLSRLYVVKSDSGDADTYERLEDVTAYSRDVRELATAVRSISAFFPTPEYESAEGQMISWVWNSDSPSPLKREARITFDPPVTKNRPITYERRGKVYNLFHFNQQERRDASDGKETDEFIELAVQNAYDLVVLTVAFPEGNWPDKFYRVVHNDRCFNKHHDKTCTPDPDEEAHFSLHFSKFKDARTIVVSLEKPLPGYTYWIYWTLPPMEEDERDLNAGDRGRALELGDKLTKLLEAGNPDNAKVQLWLNNMLQDVITSKLWTNLDGSDELEVSLYAYDADRRGLVCVSSSRDALWSNVIKSGETLIGPHTGEESTCSIAHWCDTRRPGSSLTTLNTYVAFPGTGAQRASGYTPQFAPYHSSIPSATAAK